MCTFTKFFFLWFSYSWRVLWYFYVRKQLFYFKKVLAPRARALAGKCRLWYLDGACRPIRWANIPFFRVIGCTVVSSTIWDNKHFFFLIFCHFQRKCTFVLFSLNLSISILLFFIVYCHPWSYYKSFSFFFQFSSWIIICHILCFPIKSLFFWFLIFFLLTLLLKFCWLSITSFNQSLCFFIVFNLALILLIYFLFLLKFNCL
jgi:hypothetical protein